MKINNAEQILEVAIEAVQKKKGNDILKMDLRHLDNAVTDYFVICHADSTTQVGAIAEEIEQKLKEEINEKVWHREGSDNAFWILLDYSDVVIHVFQKEYREFYSLESLWADATFKKIKS